MNADVELFRKTDTEEFVLVDSAGEGWNFKGCATSGPAAGKCFAELPAIKIILFDWRLSRGHQHLPALQSNGYPENPGSSC